MNIQAIETTWRGIKFRSRQEARWAVFLDTLKVPYFYEPEGYALPSGPYLPDFFLPEQDCFVEIKGAAPTLEEGAKASELALATGKDVFIFFGPIDVPNLGANESAHKYLGGIPDAFDCGHYWCECPNCGKVAIQFNGRADRIRCRCQKSQHGNKGYNEASPRLVGAYNAARRERFGT